MRLREVDIDEIDKINLQHDREVDRISALCEVYARPPEHILDLIKVDPFSPEYTRMMRDWLCLISGRNYAPASSECANFLDEQVFRDQIQLGLYGFGDSVMVGEMLQSYGGVIKVLAVRAEQSVLEYGPGEGQIALNLARMGCRVTVTDIEARYLHLIRRQAEQLHTDIHTIHGHFGDAEPGRTYDRILFFESFHHALDHHVLIAKLKQQLAPDGFIVFAGEPIIDFDNFYRPTLPYAWGPRLDGLSIRAMQTYGWCELGFSREYFIELLTRSGFLVSFKRNEASDRASAYIARRAGRVVDLGGPILLEGHTHPNCWHEGEGAIRWSRSETAVLPLDCSWNWRACTLRMRNDLPLRREVEIRTGTHVLHVVVEAGAQEDVLILRPLTGRLEIHCTTVRPCDIIPESRDDRHLGIAVNTLEYHP